jgi:pimeloyl-ACP methyl ester carboxylesterase
MKLAISAAAMLSRLPVATRLPPLDRIRWRLSPGAAHLAEWDNPDAMNKAIRDFLRDVDAGKVRR